MEHPILDALKPILEPMGEERSTQILQWVREEISTRPLVAYCYDGIAENPWEISKESPITEGAIVFAMVHWEEQRAVCAYCCKPGQVNGQLVFEFSREIIHDPKHTTGPASHEALFNDLRAFFQYAKNVQQLSDFIAYAGKSLDASTTAKLVGLAKAWIASDDGEVEGDADQLNGHN